MFAVRVFRSRAAGPDDHLGEAPIKQQLGHTPVVRRGRVETTGEDGNLTHCGVSKFGLGRPRRYFGPGQPRPRLRWEPSLVLS